MLEATMSVRMSDGEKSLITDWAKTCGLTASQFMRRCALEAIEDELDVQAYLDAEAEFDADPVTHPNDDVMREFGLR